MLARTHAATKKRRQRQRKKRERTRRSEATKRWRRRARNGRAVYPVETDADVLSFLVRMRWLAEADAGDRMEVGAAISRLLKDAAQS